MKKSKALLSLLVSLLPMNMLRILGYRLLFRYDISFDCQIGFLNLLLFDSCSMRGAKIGVMNYLSSTRCDMAPGSAIGYLNKCVYVYRLSLGEGAVLGSQIRITGGRPGRSPYPEAQSFFVGAKSIITRKHTFDVLDSITIGDDVTFGGSATEVWTHGFDLNHVCNMAAVSIGDRVYIGSRCLILPGVSITGNVSIGSGTVVAKSITESGFYVSSQLVRKGDATDLRQAENKVEHRGACFVRK